MHKFVRALVPAIAASALAVFFGGAAASADTATPISCTANPVVGEYEVNYANALTIRDTPYVITGGDTVDQVLQSDGVWEQITSVGGYVDTGVVTPEAPLSQLGTFSVQGKGPIELNIWINADGGKMFTWKGTSYEGPGNDDYGQIEASLIHGQISVDDSTMIHWLGGPLDGTPDVSLGSLEAGTVVSGANTITGKTKFQLWAGTVLPGAGKSDVTITSIDGDNTTTCTAATPTPSATPPPPSATPTPKGSPPTPTPSTSTSGTGSSSSGSATPGLPDTGHPAVSWWQDIADFLTAHI
jgi:hypothetical protein